jgi:hypothetical protein
VVQLAPSLRVTRLGTGDHLRRFRSSRRAHPPWSQRPHRLVRSPPSKTCTNLTIRNNAIRRYPSPAQHSTRIGPGGHTCLQYPVPGHSCSLLGTAYSPPLSLPQPLPITHQFFRCKL